MTQAATADLERWLRRPDLHPDTREAVEAELGRRYTDELLHPVGPPPSPGPAPGHYRSTYREDRSGDAPGSWSPTWAPPGTPSSTGVPPGAVRPGPGPAPTRGSARDAARSASGGCLSLVVIAFVVLLAVGWLGGRGRDRPISTPLSNVCVTPRGTCQIPREFPLGTSCTCTGPLGADTGTVR